MTPEQLLYAKTHEWVSVETLSAGEKIATVGISAFALEALTDLVFMELPEVGRRVKVEEPFGEVESVKAVSDLLSPVDGEVVDVNNEIADDLEKMADDPYGAGWLIKVKLSGDAGLSKLMEYPAYKEQCSRSNDQ